MVTVKDILEALKTDTKVVRIDYDIVPSEVRGYKVTVEYDRKTNSGKIVRYFREFVVEGENLTDNEVLGSEAYEVRITVRNPYLRIWHRGYRGRR